MRQRLAENLAGWCADTGSLSVSPPLLHRNKIIIHETGMKSRRLFYLIVIRTASEGERITERAFEAKRRSVRIGRNGKERQPRYPGSKKRTWGTLRVSLKCEREEFTDPGHPATSQELTVRRRRIQSASASFCITKNAMVAE